MRIHDRLSVIGLGLFTLASAACGNEPVTSGTATDTTGLEATSTTSQDTSPTTTTGSPTGEVTESATGPTEGGVSDSEGTTVSPTSTGQITATEPGDSTTTTGDETTTTGDGTTSTSTSSTTTTGDETTGTSTTGVSDTEGDQCPLAQMHLPCDADSNELLHALGLNCTSLGGDWVNNTNAVAVTEFDLQAPPVMFGERTWQVTKTYGTYIDPNTNKPFWSAREGDKMLMISSGLIPNPNAQGQVTIADDDVYDDTAFGGQWDSDVMPPPMSAQKGSPDPMGFTNCDGVNDCSNTIFDQWQLGSGDPEDKMWFSFKLTSPSIAAGDIADAFGYTFEFAYFSAEFPEYVDSTFNDIFVVWQSSEEYTGNVVFINGQPLTVTALWPIDFQEFDPHLDGTGFNIDGGATGWYKATGGVLPGETFQLAFAIFDMGDSSFDTTALIDNWLWDCEGCIPNEVDSCGIAPQ